MAAASRVKVAVLKRPAAAPKSHMAKRKRGRVVSKKASEHGKRQSENLLLWTNAVSKARKELGLVGFVPVGGKSAAGQRLYVRAKAIYGVAQGATPSSSPQKARKFEEVKDHFNTSLLPQIQEETLQLLAVLADKIEFASSQTQKNESALSEELLEAESKLKEVQAPSNMRLLAATLRTLHTQLSAEMTYLREQMQNQQNVISDLEQRCKDFAAAAMSDVEPNTASDALEKFRETHSRRQQFAAEELLSAGQDSLAQLQDIKLGMDVPALLKSTTKQWQQKISEFMHKTHLNETKELASIQERCEQSENLCARSKELVQESAHAMAVFHAAVNASCERTTPMFAQSEQCHQELNSLANEIDQKFATVKQTVARAQAKHEAALSAQAYECELRKEQERTSEMAMRLHQGFQGAMKHYFQEPAVAATAGA